MTYVPENPLIVQSDHTILVEVASPHYGAVRDHLIAFAELVKSPEYVHTWRLTPLSLWNAAAAGHAADDVIAALERWAKFPVPPSIPDSVRAKMGKYGALSLVRDGEWLRLEGREWSDIEAVRSLKAVDDLVDDSGGRSLRVHPMRRGELKQALIAFGHPVEDLAGFDDGEALSMRLSERTPDGEPWSMREYQRAAVDAFHGGPGAGCGVVVLPCGAGKTLVGVAAMVRLGMRTLILCTGHTALQQWRSEILRRTTLTDEDIGEYSSQKKEIRPVTLTTYQLLTWRRDTASAPAHIGLFHRGRWGLIIYDEVHLLPAPVFREVAGVQARRRLGLTATLVREDGLEGDVFALIGPKRFDIPWRSLEARGWIATARCVEVRIPLSDDDRARYLQLGARERFMLASRNVRKGPVLEALMARHPDDQILILGTYIEQLEWLARRFSVPLITGKTTRDERDAWFAAFRSGQCRVLALSKVGNFAVDLPNATVAVQVSGSWGSRQEEAQRLGRVLRAKKGANQAVFYSLVSEDTREQEMAERRQLFLAEQGYPYRIEHIR